MKAVVRVVLLLAAPTLAGCHTENQDDQPSCLNFSSDPPLRVNGGLYYGKAILDAASNTPSIAPRIDEHVHNEKWVFIDRNAETVTVRELLADGGPAEETVFRIARATIAQ